MAEPSKRKLVYDALSREFDLGDFAHFDSLMNDPQKRQIVYDAASDRFDLGGFPHFDSLMAEGMQEVNIPGDADTGVDRSLLSEVGKRITDSGLIDLLSEKTQQGMGFDPGAESPGVLQRVAQAGIENNPTMVATQMLLNLLGVSEDLGFAGVASVRHGEDFTKAFVEGLPVFTPEDFTSDSEFERFRKLGLPLPVKRTAQANVPILGASSTVPSTKDMQTAQEKADDANFIGRFLFDPSNFVGVGLANKFSKLSKRFKDAVRSGDRAEMANIVDEFKALPPERKPLALKEGTKELPAGATFEAGEEVVKRPRATVRQAGSDLEVTKKGLRPLPEKEAPDLLTREEIKEIRKSPEIKRGVQAPAKKGKKDVPDDRPDASTVRAWVKRQERKIKTDDVKRFGFGEGSRENRTLIMQVGQKDGLEADEMAEAALAQGIIDEPPFGVNLTDHFMQQVKDNSLIPAAQLSKHLEELDDVTQINLFKDQVITSSGNVTRSADDIALEEALDDIFADVPRSAKAGEPIKDEGAIQKAFREKRERLRDRGDPEAEMEQFSLDMTNVLRKINGKPPVDRAGNIVDDSGEFMEETIRRVISDEPPLTGSGKVHPDDIPEPRISGLGVSQEFRTSLREKIQDSKIRLRRLQERPDIVTKGKGLDPYEAEIRFHGRVGAKLRKTKETVEKIDKNIIDVAKKFKVDDQSFIDDVNGYLIARHAPERNAALGKADAAGMTDEQAAQLLADIEAKPHFAQIKPIIDDVQDLNNQTLDILRDAEVISDDLHDLLRNRYGNHVPLNRILENTDDVAGVLNSRGLSVGSSGLRRAKGSTLEVDDILTNVVANVQQAIVKAEKNRVMLSTLEFTRNNAKSGLFKEVKPKAIGLRFDKETPIFNRRELLDNQSVIVAMEKGKPVFIRVEDRMLARAMDATNNEVLDWVTRVVGTFTRYITATATRFNPAFQLPNLVRDTQEMVAFLAAQKEFGIKGALGTTRKIPQSLKDVYDGVRGIDSDGGRLYRQMVDDGGTTGGIALSTRKQVEIDLKKIRRANRSAPRKTLKALEKFFDDYNAIFEDATRLTVYRSSLARGLTREEAAVFAKEATLNFNRRGTVGAHFNAWFAFSNASIQGSRKILAAFKNPKVLTAVTSTTAAAVYFQAHWNDMIDPEWRDKVPEWERNNSLVILLPTDGPLNRINVPVSWGIKPIKTSMEYFSDISLGHNRGNARQIAGGVLAATMDSYNPLGGSNFRQAVTPTIADIPADVALNETWFGRPIKPDDPYLPNKPEHLKFFRSSRKKLVNNYLIDITRYMAENGGIDVSPETFRYTIEQLGGGSLRFLRRTANTVYEVGADQSLSVDQAPIVSRFFKSTPEDIVEFYQENKRLNDPALKTLQIASDREKALRKLKVKDRFDQYLETDDRATRHQIKVDLRNEDPRAYRSFLRRLKDHRKGITYFDSVLKDLDPEFRAERVLVELERAPDSRARWVELRKRGVINAATLKELRKDPEFDKLVK